jgi:hypothetical protein
MDLAGGAILLSDGWLEQWRCQLSCWDCPDMRDKAASRSLAEIPIFQVDHADLARLMLQLFSPPLPSPLASLTCISDATGTPPQAPKPEAESQPQASLPCP